MLLHACGGFSKTLPGHSRLHRYSGASRGLQGPPGASRGLQRPPERLHLPRSGWTRPPTMAGGGGGGAEVLARAWACLQGGVEGVFKGI